MWRSEKDSVNNRAQTQRWMSKNNVKANRQEEAKDLFEKLISWKEESHRQISSTINSLSSNIDIGFQDLVEEVCGIQSELLVLRKERTVLLDTVGNLNSEIRQLNSKLRPLSDPEADNNHDTLKMEMTDFEVAGAAEMDQEDTFMACENYEEIGADSGDKSDEDLYGLALNGLTDVGVDDIDHDHSRNPHIVMMESKTFGNPRLENESGIGKSKSEREAETRKRINLSIKEKREIIRKYDALPKMSQESAGNLLKIHRSTLREILSKREAIFAAPKGEIKRNRVSKGAAVEDSLIEWFDTVRDKNAIITHKILRAKAEELAKKLGHGDFTASSGWLSRLLKRRDISCKKQHGESRSSDFKQGQTG